MADFSKTQSPEAVEARAYVAWEGTSGNSGGVGDAQPGSFYFWSLAPGGSVIERIQVVMSFVGASAIGTTYETTSDPNVQGVPELGSWFVGRSSMNPTEIYTSREPGGAQLAPGGIANPTLQRAKFEMGEIGRAHV